MRFEQTRFVAIGRVTDSQDCETTSLSTFGVYGPCCFTDQPKINLLLLNLDFLIQQWISGSWWHFSDRVVSFRICHTENLAVLKTEWVIWRNSGSLSPCKTHWAEFWVPVLSMWESTRFPAQKAAVFNCKRVFSSGFGFKTVEKRELGHKVPSQKEECWNKGRDKTFLSLTPPPSSKKFLDPLLRSSPQTFALKCNKVGRSINYMTRHYDPLAWIQGKEQVTGRGLLCHKVGQVLQKMKLSSFIQLGPLCANILNSKLRFIWTVLKITLLCLMYQTACLNQNWPKLNKFYLVLFVRINREPPSTVVWRESPETKILLNQREKQSIRDLNPDF